MHVDSADRERQFWIRNAGVRCSSHLGSTIQINILGTQINPVDATRDCSGST